MSDDKVVKFQNTHRQRRKNELGTLNVECRVSGRILRFHEASAILSDGEYITIDVYPMQIEDDNLPKNCAN